MALTSTNDQNKNTQATENEIKKYKLSATDADNFLDLINISEKDFEIVYNVDSKNVYHTYVKFHSLGAQVVDLIMKVAVDQLQARIQRQKEWDRLKRK